MEADCQVSAFERYFVEPTAGGRDRRAAWIPIPVFAGTTVQEPYPIELARNTEALWRADVGFKSIGTVEPATHRRVVQARARTRRVVFTAISMKASSGGEYLRSLYDH
jgi:hypothetical protein